MVIVSIIIIRNQENSEALSAHSVWSQAALSPALPSIRKYGKYRVKRLLWRYCSGCLCTNVVIIPPTPHPTPPESGKPTEEAWCLLTIIRSDGLPSRKYGDIVRDVCVPMSSSYPPPPPPPPPPQNQENPLKKRGVCSPSSFQMVRHHESTVISE